MGRVSRDVWAKRVERWRESGLTAKEFSAEIGIKSHSLTYWAWKLGAAAKAEKAQRSEPEKPSEPERLEWVEVATPRPDTSDSMSAPTALELVVGRATVRVPPRFDAAALGRLLDVLEAR
jgi:hypothetical protein